MSRAQARSALEPWLAKADRVLAEARSTSLSPLMAPGPWEQRSTEQGATLSELQRN